MGVGDGQDRLTTNAHGTSRMAIVGKERTFAPDVCVSELFDFQAAGLCAKILEF
jgi:hypothetical protein